MVMMMIRDEKELPDNLQTLGSFSSFMFKKIVFRPTYLLWATV